MKSYKQIAEKYTPQEIAESYVFAGVQNDPEREKSLQNFKQWRKENEAQRTTESRFVVRLLQLKFLMEDYLQQPHYNKDYDFSYFLKEYISRLEKKNKEFADEIDVDQTELSQIVNKHRVPNEKFIIRLEIHSNQNFPAMVWFKLVERERIYELMNDKKLRTLESKHVKSKLNFTF